MLSVAKIYNNYPIIFRNCQRQGSGMPCIYIDVMPGWLPLVSELCAALEQVAHAQMADGVTEAELPSVRTIKTKFCQLRCNISGRNIDHFIERYADRAQHICEQCSSDINTKIMERNGTYRLLCEPCGLEFRGGP
ncbi:hypothetical protein [Methylophaga pinxianii]|uniref:hypothetical protein n=1 Tax=Methylophaga pinxianii TaxID=2881052 RepID=UPI001CF47BEE|nr:hypothetical protein [Methylophaga pinxianii]MCB2427126.1 hypothetical protein [Methylophaga pinxianii]UPH44971.1 hypothetical protein LGT42_010665 [Methylophaga pinxianii]